MAREYNYQISQAGKAIFLDLIIGGQVEGDCLIDLHAVSPLGISCFIDGDEMDVKVKVKTEYEFAVRGDIKVGTGWPLEQANKARDAGDDFYMVFIDYKTGRILGGRFLDLIEPREFDSISWPYQYNAAGQQVELYSIHLMNKIGSLKAAQREELLRLAVLNRKADQSQIDLF